MTFKTTIVILVISSIFSLFWSIVPMFGWSHYSLEGTLTSCSVEWFERSLNVISYNISMFIFVFFIPLILIILSNIGLLTIVKQSNNKNYKTQKIIKNEKNLTKSLMITIGN
jgi:uncharacterized membrane protein